VAQATIVKVTATDIMLAPPELNNNAMSIIGSALKIYIITEIFTADLVRIK
jgi:hypothetical protein